MVACAGGFKNYLGNTKHALNNIYVYPDAPRIPPPPLAAQVYRNDFEYTVAKQHLQDFFTEPYCANSDGQALGDSGWGDIWSNNTCLMYGDVVYNFGTCDPSNPQPGILIPTLQNNRFFNTNASYLFTCGGSTFSLSEAQHLGVDTGSQVGSLPPIMSVIDEAWAMLTAQL